MSVGWLQCKEAGCRTIRLNEDVDGRGHGLFQTTVASVAVAMQ
jgi:hypothetical protein